MLAHRFILTGAREFAKVKDEGRTIQSVSFGASFIKSKANELSRFGFIVSNKIVKQAVIRNRIKRAMKDAVRLSLDETAKGLVLVFFAKREAVKRSRVEIMDEVKNVLKKTTS